MHFTHFTTMSFKYWFKDKSPSNISHTKSLDKLSLACYVMLRYQHALVKVLNLDSKSLAWAQSPNRV